MIYPGGKNGAGVYHLLINQMPPHECYIEPFLGSGAIMRHKRPAAVNIGLDTSAEAIITFNLHFRREELGKLIKGEAPDDKFTVRVGDGFQFLREGSWDTETTLIYCDPPYLREVRSSKDRIYSREFGTPEEHGPLLTLLDKKRCMVMISGYDSKLYVERLRAPKWRKIVYTAGSRGGPRDECLWMNFQEPMELHDYSFLGSGYRERERIRRKQKRWRRKLLATPRLERLALMSVIEELRKGPERGGVC